MDHQLGYKVESKKNFRDSFLKKTAYEVNLPVAQRVFNSSHVYLSTSHINPSTEDQRSGVLKGKYLELLAPSFLRRFFWKAPTLGEQEDSECRGVNSWSSSQSRTHSPTDASKHCFVDRRLFQRNNPEFQNEDDIFFKIQFTVTKLKTQTLNLLSEQSSEKL
eukprot:bmy_19737T0